MEIFRQSIVVSLEFVDSGLYFVRDENNFIYPSLQVESGEKRNGSGSPKINGSDRIRILIPVLDDKLNIFILNIAGQKSW